MAHGLGERLSGEVFPARAGIDDFALLVENPGHMRAEFEHVAKMAEAFAESFFGALGLGDVHNGNGDAEDLAGLVARGLIGKQDGLGDAVIRHRLLHFDAEDGFALQRAADKRLNEGKQVGNDFGDGFAEVRADGSAIHFCEAAVDADVAHAAIEEAEADGGSVVDGLDLREALGGEGFVSDEGVAVGVGGHDGGEGFGLGGEHAGDIVDGGGLAVKVALTEIAAQPEEHAGLRGSLDAFGDGSESEALAEADDSGDDFPALTHAGHGADETSVDLEAVEGEGLEVAQAGVAGAEVVEGEAAAELLQLAGNGIGAGEVFEERALGDFDDDAVEREASLLRAFGDDGGNAGILQLDRGKIDGEMEGVVGECWISEGLAEQGPSEAAAEPGGFDPGDKFVRRGVLPTGEQFEARALPGSQLDDRLEGGEKLVIVQCPLQPGRIGFHATNVRLLRGSGLQPLYRGGYLWSNLVQI